MNKKIITNLQQARNLIQESEKLLEKIKVSEKVNDEWVITEEFENTVQELSLIEEAVKTIQNAKDGSLDYLKNKVKELAIEKFFKNHKGLKSYEGKKMVIGYRLVERKVITDKDNVDKRFVIMEMKPDTKKIDGFRKATISEDNLEGLLPTGIEISTFEYITYKAIKK